MNIEADLLDKVSGVRLVKYLKPKKGVRYQASGIRLIKYLKAESYFRRCSMKKIWFLLLLLPVSSFAAEWGVGVNYPGLGVKYGLDKKNTVELRTQFGEDVFVMGPRLYHSLSSMGKTVVYGGGEVLDSDWECFRK